MESACPSASEMQSIHQQYQDLEGLEKSLPECTSSLLSLYTSVKPPKVDEVYDKEIDRVLNCITSTRNVYKGVESALSSLYDKYKEGVVSSESYPTVLSVPKLGLSFDLSVLNDHLLVEKENDIAFLSSLRSIFKRVKSVDTIAMMGNEVAIHMKEDCDLKVVVERDVNSAVTLKSATLRPSYPCFQKAIAYSIERNDIGLLADQTIYALYAHKRLHSEMESLSEMASVSSEDDVHLKAAYPDGTVVEFSIPEIYPNSFGMITVQAIHGARKEEVEKAMKDHFFSDVTGIVEFVSGVVKKCCVCYKSDGKQDWKDSRSSIAQLVRACGC